MPRMHPGAADFYYGEMELRRHNSDAALGERFVLRLTGPVLLGLALLSVRNRVKR
jgi:hypothetical protein